MSKKTFIFTEKIEFVPDEELERELEFNLRAAAYVYNKALEYSIYRKNLVKEFAIGAESEVNRKYTQKILKELKKQKNFLEKSRIHLPSCIHRPPNTILQRIL